jgi:hypothetical protein
MESYGALVGWTHQEIGDRILLRLESVKSVEAARSHDPDLYRMMLTKQQANVLGNFLLQIAGNSPADPKDRSWFRRLFG